MYPIYHFVLTLIASGFLLPVLGWKIVLFWLGSFFIDIDHFWWYILKYKNLSLREAYDYGKNNHEDKKLHIFHTIEFWSLLGIWSIFSEYALVILFGLVYHIVIDLTDMIARKIWNSRILSFFNWYYLR